MGECAKNPAYMVGRDDLRGFCLPACGLCSPRESVIHKDRHVYLTEESVRKLAQVQQRLAWWT